MGVELAKGANVVLDREGNIKTVECPGCGARYRNPLRQSDYKTFDKGVELRMSRGIVQIRCEKCRAAIVTVKA